MDTVIGLPQVGRLAPYGKAWYVNPELWGLESSQVESAIHDQEDEDTEGKTLCGLRFAGHLGMQVVEYWPAVSGEVVVTGWKLASSLPTW